MKKISLFIAILTYLLVSCESTENKTKKKAEHLASLTCESSRDGRTAEEMQAIGDACFRRGSYTKSSGKEW
jgi:hypothetical protein